MALEIEKHPRFVIAIAALFAISGLVAVVTTTWNSDSGAQGPEYAEVFKTPEQIEKEMIAKRKVLESLAAASTSTGARISEEEKLRVLESLRVN